MLRWEALLQGHNKFTSCLLWQYSRPQSTLEIEERLSAEGKTRQ